jgi:membrane protein DedA with SNARE-associated domain
VTSAGLPPAALAGPVGADAAGDVVAAYGLGNFPFGAVVALLFVIVLARAQGTYWLGRGIAAGTVRAGFLDRLGGRLVGPRMATATASLVRWGPLAVTLSFLTVGLQTMINAAAGLTRMPYLRYTLAMVPGCAVWAFIYATIGMTAFYAGVAAAAGSGWGLLAVALVLVLRRRRAGSPSVSEPSRGAAEASDVL